MIPITPLLSPPNTPSWKAWQLHALPDWRDKCNCVSRFFAVIRAYADAGPSVQHSAEAAGEEADFVKDADSDSEKSVEASSGDDEAKDEDEEGEGKKKKPRSGFRDRKVINKQ